SGAVKIAAGNEKVNGAVKLFNHNSDNRYQYRDKNDGLNEVRTSDKAAFGLTGALADLKFRTAKGHLVSVHGWLTDNFRNIPSPARRGEFSTQKDRSSRLLSAWGYGRGPWLTQARG